MQSSSQPSKPRRFDATKRTVPKPRTSALPKEDKNMNTIPNPAARRVTKAPVASPRTRLGAQPRPPLYQPKSIAQKPAAANFKAAKPKAKTTRTSAANQLSASPAPPSLLPLDPNCNEPSLPCLCCDGRSPQDSNSMFNHNHNNNNTISLRQQMQLPAPPGPLFQKQEEMRVKEEQPKPALDEPQKDNAASMAASLENDNKSDHELDISNNGVKVDEDDDDDDSSGDIDIDEEEEPDHYGDDEDDDDDDTLVPSCCDCPPSLLDFSLSSSTSSSSTSISSCSDLDSDSADQTYSMSSSNDQENLSFMLSPKVCCPESKPPARSLPSLPRSRNPFYLSSPASPDEGYPSALDSPDYLGIKEDCEMSKLSLLDFLESVGEFGKMERFSQVIQVARWDLEGEQHWDVLRDRIDHLDRLEKVNREVKLAYIAKLHEKGYDLSDLVEQDLSDIMDEMGNIDIPWKLYKNPKGKMQDSQEFSDAGVDLTAPSDCEDPLAPDSLTPSPIEAPPKPPARHASVTSDLHTYINISREPSTSVATSPTPLSTFSLHTTSPTFTTFRCEKSSPVTPPSIPPLPASKQLPYLTLYTAPSPTIPTPTPPIPPPRTRHLARKEAQRRAALLAEQEKSPDSLPPPTTRPPPLPPPPVISVTSTSPPAIPPPPALPPPPSFHALDVEIRKLLMLAGLTQAELLKISPELGNCVGGYEDEDDVDNVMSSCDFTVEDLEEDTQSGNGLVDSLCYRGVLEGKDNNEERKDVQKTTSFGEMARRRKKNTAYTSAPYYRTGPSNSKDNYEMLHYDSQRPSSPPPPPPPRPLPPIPSCANPKSSTLQANSAQPERFDWLIAFTPDSDEMRKRALVTSKKCASSSVKSSSTGSGPKTTTFKELRNRKSSSPPIKFINAAEPDPNIITPDPDLLYNLKWRRDKAGDGTQWEYTSQAQALFMQPPPALTSMAALQEMLQRAEEENAKKSISKLCPPQNTLGCSVSDSSLWNLGIQWEHEDGKMEGKNEESEVEVRGQADGERTAEFRTAAVRSVSFAGSVHRVEPWMARDVGPLMRGLGLSPESLQEKRALVSAVSVAVEAILAQFSSSRTVVQKALSGDSAVNPSLGRLVLQCLCPALHGLLTDGLKPHHTDLIAGRRPNTAWSLVQASTRPGSKTQALFNLQARVGDLPQLRQSKHRFNAYVLGLLNIKHLDVWLSHLHTSHDVLETYYQPSSFMRLSLGACHPQFEELLLVLQPLSLLTFNLDLLFQHHHIHSPKIQSTAAHDTNTNQTEKCEQKYMESLSEEDITSGESGNASMSQSNSETTPSDRSSTNEEEDLLETSPQLRWVKEKEISSLPPPNMDEDSLTQQAGQVNTPHFEDRTCNSV